MAKRQTTRKSPVANDDLVLSTSARAKLPKLNLKNLRPKSYGPIMVILLILGAFAIGILGTKVYYLEKGTTTAQTGGTTAGDTVTVPAPGTKVDVDAGSLPFLGNKDAKVTVIEFADFQCPFCEQWFTEVGKNLIKDYVDTGKVKFAFRNFAFLGEESNFAAEAAWCANDQDKFWEYHDYLYTHQGAENSGAFSKENLKGFASALGLNTTNFNSCLDNGTHTKDVTDDTTAGSTAGVTGTPTVYVNGISLVGAQPYESLKTMIEQELNK